MEVHMSITQPLRDEHAELEPHIAALAAAGDAVGAVEVARLRQLVDDAHHFLAHQLIPHAEAEDDALYPAVQKILGSSKATATMSRDHVEVGALTEELAGLRERLHRSEVVDDELARGLRRVLYGLHHLVKVHFAKEEEVFLPILEEGLTPDDAAAMFEAMHGHDHGSHDHGSHGHDHDAPDHRGGG
jgi:iron-sulfur cluster repair protein YtfE (RIC family)